MAETDTAAPTSGGSTQNGQRKKGGLKDFVRKNKTLSVVVAGGGAYLLWRMHNESSGAPSEGEGEGGEITPIDTGTGTAQLAAFELGREERATENAEDSISEVEDELRREKEKSKEEREEREGETAPGNGNVEPGPSIAPEPPINEGAEPGTSGSQSVSIHGKNFPGATSSRIARTGKTSGGKAYVEYVISYPGRQEHWQYFTDSNHWRQVSNSAAGAGANKPGSGSNKSSSPSGATQKSTGKTKGKKKKIGVGRAKPVRRSGSSGGGGSTPSAPSCPAGTVANIQHARAEVNRLQGEINTLQGYINAHPNAKQRPEWEANIRNKQSVRDQYQGAVNRGHAVPGCAGV